MCTTHRLRGLCVFVPAVLLLGTPDAFGAGPITSFSTGSDMAGGFVTCTFFGGPMFTAPIIAVGTGCSATSPGDFVFSIAPGDTFVSDWKLTNLQAAPAGRAIGSISIDLTGTRALFDNDSLPSTPDSLDGVAGAVSLTGPGIAPGGEVNPWANGANLGDMFTGEKLSFTAFLTIGSTMTWHDDTDFVPEPSTLVAASAIPLIGLARRRRRV
ncbi:hypothetical protein BH09PLA1_BH09PLA1_29080 [soil metagenome]